MKKLLSIIFVFTIVLTSFTVCANGISVYINGSKLEFDVEPQLINDRTMVPMRKIFESLGAVVTWDDESQTATGKKDDVIVNVSIDSKILFKNGVPKTLDVAPALINSRTLVPVRAIAESFDCTVDWIDETQSVIITTKNEVNLNKRVLSATEIAEKISPSVFYVQVYDYDNYPFGSGSGFFITSDGIAVTNYHVIEDSDSAQITTTDGQKYKVTDVIAFDKDLDVAIIKIDKTSIYGRPVSSFPATTLADSDNIKAGQKVYAIGNPENLQNTISDGIISNINRQVGDSTFIQITAPISHGSSGGALLNEYGEVLGITSAMSASGQNLNFAIPINLIKKYDLNSEGMTYEDFANYNYEFTLELYTDTIELEVGETGEILVYADGRETDWSIYWHSDEDDIVDCMWGDWMGYDNNVCPLIIRGLAEGVATITVYSDVDFKGKDITVYVSKPKVEAYPSVRVAVPTYTAITGVSPTEVESIENVDFYTYKYYVLDTVLGYIDVLEQYGFRQYDKEDGDNGEYITYIAPDNEMIILFLSYNHKQITIGIPRY